MTILTGGLPATATKFTISTWVYIPSEAVEAQAKAAETLDDHVAPASVRRRIPIMEFGDSVEPRVGIHIGMECNWEGYLGEFWWNGFIFAPEFPDRLCEYWIGGLGMGRDGWFPFASGTAVNEVDYATEWHNAFFIMFTGTATATWGTSFYPHLDEGSFPILPDVLYNNFNDTGILPFFVINRGPRGPYFAKSTDSYEFGLPLSWTYKGSMKATANFSPGRVSVKPEDIATPSILVNSERFFAQFYPSDLNFTMQPTPTTGPSWAGTIAIDTGGTSKHYAYGDLVVVFPELPNVTYGEPAIPSSLYYDGNANFLLTAKWPEKTTHADEEIVPTLTFSGGSLSLDKWNHIYFAVDLSTMRIEGGQDDPTKMIWVDTLAGPVRTLVGLSPPTMTEPPKSAFIVNGQRSSGDPVAQLTVYPSKEGHWSSNPTIEMILQRFGMPILQREIGRYKVTGPNQNIMFAYTHVYIGQYIEPTEKNLSKFVWKSKNSKYNYVIPPADKKAAVKEFGTPDIWLYRDKEDGVEFQNLGRAGGLAVTGTKPKDFRPGPGQPDRKKNT